VADDDKGTLVLLLACIYLEGRMDGIEFDESQGQWAKSQQSHHLDMLQ